MTIVTIYVDNADRLSEVRFWGNTEALFCVIEYRGINCEWDDRSWLIDNRSWKKKPIEGDRYYRRLRNTRCNLMISTSHRAAITSFAQSKQEISLIMLLGRLQGWRLRNLRRLPGTSPRHVTFEKKRVERERERSNVRSWVTLCERCEIIENSSSFVKLGTWLLVRFFCSLTLG